LASSRRITRQPFRPTYRRGAAKPTVGAVARPPREGGRGGGEGPRERGDKKRATKRGGRRVVIDGRRRRLPEDYTSRRLQFTPFGKLDIHPSPSHSLSLTFFCPPPPSLPPSLPPIPIRLAGCASLAG
jgi:hypothetical protein